jgi:hypothetical protein
MYLQTNYEFEQKVLRDEGKDITIESEGLTLRVVRIKFRKYQRTVVTQRCVCGQEKPKPRPWVKVASWHEDEIVAKNWSVNGVKLW